MNPNRALDAVLAARVFGCQVHQILATDDPELKGEFECGCQGRPHQGWKDGADGLRYSVLKQYSTDKVAAREVWDKMHDDPKLFGRFVPHLQCLTAYPKVEGSPTQYGWDRCSPLAICEAALKAVCAG